MAQRCRRREERRSHGTIAAATGRTAASRHDRGLRETKSLILGNAAPWMFTVTMDGCTFGIGSQPGATGDVRVAHANNGSMAGPSITIGGDTGRAAQRRIQALLATSHVGPGSILIEPDSYMGGDLSVKATTFGFHANAGAWTFKALSHRIGGNVALHGGVIDYP